MDAKLILLAKETQRGEGMAPGKIVLAHFVHIYGEDHPANKAEFVTWFHNDQVGGYCHGHYFPATSEGLRKALADFEGRS